jgi:hypothetical protein
MWVQDSSVDVSIMQGDTATGGMITDECNSGSKATYVTSVIIHVPSFVRSPRVMGLCSIPTIASTQFGMPDPASPHGMGAGLGSIETQFKVTEIYPNKTKLGAIIRIDVDLQHKQ